ncbi:MAG: DUF721 domain-containing protein [Candidatus Babeliaceae bacterium]
MTKLLKNIIPTLFPQHDWRWRLLTHWQEVVGPLHTHMRLEKIDNDIVFIGVYDSHWMQELFMLSRDLLHTMNAKLDKPHINHLRFSLVDQRSVKNKNKVHK